MPALIVYLLKVNAALCLFYIAYRFALRPLTFYYLNRFFLVFGIVFSTVYPLVDISALFTKDDNIRQKLTTIVPNWNTVLPAVQHQAATINYWGVPIALFWLGVFLMSVRLAVQFISLYRIHKSSQQTQYYGHSFRSVRDEVNPFSFWQEIYLNPDKHTDAELRAIIQHEQVHVKQWHTLDVILAELSVVFYWFNPGVWFMKQAVKENLEFITDREILRSGVDEKVYQYSLVRVGALKPGAAIVNNFNFLTIKKRIMMMNKKNSSKAHITRYVVLLPLVMLLALVFTVSKAELNNKSIAVLVKKILPLNIVSKPSQAIAPVIAAPKRDTTKIKLTYDTAKRITATRVNGKRINDTIILRDTVNAKTIRAIRINGVNLNTDDKKDVVIVDDKKNVQNLTLSSVPVDKIESIQVVSSDSVRAFTTVRANSPKTVVVHVKPFTSSSFSTAVSPNTSFALTTVNIAPGKNVAYTSNYNNEESLSLMIDPVDVKQSDIKDAVTLFKKDGFDLSIHVDKGDANSGSIKITIKSMNKGNAASATYSTNDLKNYGYVIKVSGDKDTGRVSVLSVKR